MLNCMWRHGAAAGVMNMMRTASDQFGVWLRWLKPLLAEERRDCLDCSGLVQSSPGPRYRWFERELDWKDLEVLGDAYLFGAENKRVPVGAAEGYEEVPVALVLEEGVHASPNKGLEFKRRGTSHCFHLGPNV